MVDLKQTPLHDLHVELGARLVPFAGYEMPVQYPMGVLKEHLHCRAKAGLFDVSHMGQIIVEAPDGVLRQAALALESLIPMDVVGLREGRQRYGLLTNDAGGIEDDLMIAHRGDHYLLVVNAARKEADLAHLRRSVPAEITATPRPDRALLALQGPEAARVLGALAPGANDLRFLDMRDIDSRFGALWISRSGYTGEDGFEISVAADQAERLARALLADDAVAPIGLGARDSLRLEAGLCLYGTDIDASSSPGRAGLGWAIPGVRRTGGARAGGFPGAGAILLELEAGVPRGRVGLRPDGRRPMRAGTMLFDVQAGGAPAGSVTSGAFGPSVESPVSMGYVVSSCMSPGTCLWGEVRGKRLPVTVVALPFRPPNYNR